MKAPSLLDEQEALVKRRHLSDLDALRLVARAEGIAGKIPRRKVKAVLELIDEERGKLQEELAAPATPQSPTG